MDIIFYIFKALKFDNYEAQISLRDPKNKEKYIGSDENWHLAEQAIIEACAEKGLKARTELGEAAFYGPKLDFMVKGRNRPPLAARNNSGRLQPPRTLPARIHRSRQPEAPPRDDSPRTLRFDGTLRGRAPRAHRGRFPLWLAPDQAVVLPISEKFNDYAYQVARELNAADVRAIVDDRNEKIGKKIRDNELKRIPYLLIVGEKKHKMVKFP